MGETIELFPPKYAGDSETLIPYDGERTVALAREFCGQLFAAVPDRIVAVLDRTVHINGFRHASKAGRPRLFRTLTEREDGPELLSVVFSLAARELVAELRELAPGDIAPRCPELAARHGSALLRYVLLTDPRPEVNALADPLREDRLPADQPEMESSTAARAGEPAPDDEPSPDGDAGEQAQPAPPETVSPPPASGLSSVVARLQREVERLRKVCAQKDERIAKLQQEAGRLGATVGELRAKNKELAEQYARSQERVARLEEELAAHKRALAEQAPLQEQRRALDREKKAIERLIEGAQGPMQECVRAHVRAHDLEAHLTILNLLLRRRQECEERIAAELDALESVPLEVCRRAILAHVEAAFADLARETAARGPLSPEDRAERAARFQFLATLESLLSRLDLGGRTVAAAELLSPAPGAIAARLRAAWTQSVTLEGTVRYEGPAAWLSAGDDAIGLPPALIEQWQMITGDQARVALSLSPNFDVQVEVDAFEQTPRLEINEALRDDDGVLWVRGHAGERVLITDTEYYRSRLSREAPVLVLIPDPNRLREPVPGPLYGRLVKEHQTAGFLPERVNRTRRRKDPSARSDEPQGDSQAPPAFLAGRRVLVVGGGVAKSRFREAVEELGGVFDWQEGFGRLNEIAGKVSAADLVVIVTGHVYHCVSGLAEAAAARHNVELVYLNNTGKTSLVNVLAYKFAHAAQAEGGLLQGA